MEIEQHKEIILFKIFYFELLQTIKKDQAIFEKILANKKLDFSVNLPGSHNLINDRIIFSRPEERRAHSSHKFHCLLLPLLL